MRQIAGQQLKLLQLSRQLQVQGEVVSGLHRCRQRETFSLFDPTTYQTLEKLSNVRPLSGINCPSKQDPNMELRFSYWIQLRMTI